MVKDAYFHSNKEEWGRVRKYLVKARSNVNIANTKSYSPITPKSLHGYTRY